ncbi:DUF1684 domain-containing protein [Jatrophihabitans sp. YIM 134969]
MTTTTATDTDFALAWQDWHRAHEVHRADAHGFLAITSLRWLDDRPTRFDDAPGEWSTTDAEGIVVQLGEGETLTVDGAPVTGRYVFGRIPERGSVMAGAGDAVIEVARRAGNDIVRPRHPDAPVRAGYRGTPTFAPDPRWARPAVFERYDAPRDVTVGAVVDGLQHVYAAPGELVVDLGDGTTHRLVAFDGLTPGTFMVLFTDATSGVTTYAANRSLSVPEPDADGRTVVDFNRATNLPCAYTPFATCPLPPEGNHLELAVEAGERIPAETV